MGNYEIYQKQGDTWIKVCDPQSLINDIIASTRTTWSSQELQGRFEALAGRLKVEIVAERPETGVLNTMYYVGATSPYHMWLYAENSATPPVETWFDMGTTEVDLSNYYTKTEVDTKFTEARTESDNTYLKLTGGTMTGPITSGDVNVFKRSNDSGYSNICGGTAWDHGATLQLGGSGDTVIGAGCFQLNAMTSTADRKKLLGKPDGSLTWDGLKIPVIKKKTFSGNTDANGFISASDIGVNQIPIGFTMDGACVDDPILYLFISSASGTYHRLKCMSWNGAGLNNRYVKGTIYYIDVSGV